MLTESTFGLTAVTLKPGPTIVNKIGTFTYRNIKKELFTGYISSYFQGSAVLIATRAKALFDFLYFKSPTLSEQNEKRNLVEELRLNLDTYTSTDIAELLMYSNMNIPIKLTKIVMNIAEHAPNH